MLPNTVDAASVDFIDTRGRVIATMTITPRVPRTLFVLSETEARGLDEEPVQLVEGVSYEYEIANVASGLRLRESSIVQPSRRHPTVGRIEPGLAVGLLPFIIEEVNGDPIGRAAVEVRSSKLDYHRDYRHMLDDLAETALGLLTDIRAPSVARLQIGGAASSEITHHQFAFLRATLESRPFRDAIARVTSVPHRQWTTHVDPIDIRRAGRQKRATIQALVSGYPRVRLPVPHPLSTAMMAAGIEVPSVPRTVPHTRAIETVDTPENRFVKFALMDFEGLLASMEQRLPGNPGTADARLRREIVRLREQLTGVLGASLFRDVSEPQYLPLGSPVLQRKGGYREILQTWLKFHLASKLTWDAGQEVFEAGKRDVALLYEYWVFFRLLKLMTRLLYLETPPAHHLIEWTRDRFDLRLKSGRMLSFEGLVRGTERPMRACFSYSRTFSGTSPGSQNYPQAGSWTRTMRPDYTISVWPAELSAHQAELEEHIVHVHFDAKYRVEHITDLFGGEGMGAVEDDERADRDNTRAKRADLLKMHAYRDAIRRTEGAYVIYPGVSGSQLWQGFHEILPGLGAFALRPDMEESDAVAIESFLREILQHVADPSTSREQARKASAEIRLKL
jgi:predicted component of viral defense system (DUF524 family)